MLDDVTHPREDDVQPVVEALRATQHAADEQVALLPVQARPQLEDLVPIPPERLNAARGIPQQLTNPSVEWRPRPEAHVLPPLEVSQLLGHRGLLGDVDDPLTAALEPQLLALLDEGQTTLGVVAPILIELRGGHVPSIGRLDARLEELRALIASDHAAA